MAAGKGTNESYLDSLREPKDSTGLSKINLGGDDIPAFHGSVVLKGALVLEDNTIIRTAADLIPEGGDIDAGTF